MTTKEKEKYIQRQITNVKVLKAPEQEITLKYVE